MRHPWPLLLCAALLTWQPPASAAHIYRWRSADGTVHFGDHPAAGAKRLDPEHEPGQRLVRVRHVLDGDTVRLTNGERIRLIGINAPELAHRGHPAQAGSQPPLRLLRKLVEGKRVHLQLEQQRRGRYGRLLAHLQLQNGRDVGKILLERGLVYVVPRPPNTAWTERYFQAERSARQAHEGLWRLPRYGIFPLQQAARYLYSFRRLKGRCLGREQQKNYTYLIFEQGVRARIANTRLAAFRQAGRGPKALVGHTLVIRGWIRQQAGKPLLRLRYPLQVERIIR